MALWLLKAAMEVMVMEPGTSLNLKMSNPNQPAAASGSRCFHPSSGSANS